MVIVSFRGLWIVYMLFQPVFRPMGLFFLLFCLMQSLFFFAPCFAVGGSCI